MKLFENEQIQISKIYAVGKYINNNNYSTEKYPNYLNTYELIYYLSGSNKTLVDGKRLTDCQGSVRYLPKGQTNGAYIVKPTILPRVCIDIFFDTISSMPSHPIAVYNFQEIQDKFMKLYTVWNQKRAAYYAESMKIFYDIICSIQKSEASYLSPTQKSYMQKADDYIANHYLDRNFNYDKLCDSTDLKYAHFSNVFKKSHGMSPVRLVTKMKIDYAKEMLMTNRFSISKISEMCGFDNIYYFSNVFKKQTGLSPKKYLAEVTQNNYIEPDFRKKQNTEK